MCHLWIPTGRTIWIIDARFDGKRFVVRADVKLTAFLKLEAAIWGQTYESYRCRHCPSATAHCHCASGGAVLFSELATDVFHVFRVHDPVDKSAFSSLSLTKIVCYNSVRPLDDAGTH